MDACLQDGCCLRFYFFSKESLSFQRKCLYILGLYIISRDQISAFLKIHHNSCQTAQTSLVENPVVSRECGACLTLTESEESFDFRLIC